MPPTLPKAAVVEGHCDWCGTPISPRRKTCNASHRAFRRNWLLQIDVRPGVPAQQPPDDSPLWQLDDPRTPRENGPGEGLRTGANARSGAQISYWKAVRMVAAYLHNQVGLDDPQGTAETILRRALPARQLERREERERAAETPQEKARRELHDGTNTYIPPEPEEPSR